MIGTKVEFDDGTKGGKGTGTIVSGPVYLPESKSYIVIVKVDNRFHPVNLEYIKIIGE